jgi:hypothetical protein
MRDMRKEVDNHLTKCLAELAQPPKHFGKNSKRYKTRIKLKMTSANNQQHLLTLKVLRLSKPSFNIKSEIISTNTCR